MSIDVSAAERFILSNARLLERHRLGALTDSASREPVLATLRAYSNPDGGFGHALEPDVRSPHSEPAATLQALEVFVEVGAFDDPMVADAAAFAESIADSEGGLPLVMPTAANYPHAPWMTASDGGSQLTFSFAGGLARAGANSPWLARGTDWCWQKLQNPQALGPYEVKFALGFLDAVPDAERAAAAIERIRPVLAPDGSLPVTEGQAGERLTPLDLSERPGARSRLLFNDEHIERDLDALESMQQEDGGWTFDWLGWSPGQTVEWRGILTLRALTTLAAHARVDWGHAVTGA